MAVKQIPRDRFPRIILARIFADGPDLLYIQVASIIVTSYILARMLREKLLSWNLSFSVSSWQIVITRSGFITQNHHLFAQSTSNSHVQQCNIVEQDSKVQERTLTAARKRSMI